MRILVADDSRLMRQLLADMLGQLRHEVTTVADGAEAYELLRRERFDVLLTDWHMPRMDGLELCWHVKTEMEDVYVIIIASDSSDDRYEKAIDTGADEFMSKDIKSSILQARIRSAERLILFRKQLMLQKQQIEEQYAQMEAALNLVREDLDAASRMQRKMTPKDPLLQGRVRFNHLFEPAAFIGGDLLSYVSLTDRHAGFFVLDVAGHGVPSALVSVSLGHMLVPGLLVLNGVPRNPASVVEKLNTRFLTEYGGDTLHFTLTYGVIDTDSGEVAFCQAGQPPAILLSRAGKATVIGDSGFPVGLVEEATFEDLHVTLQPGERIFFYTDGMSEGASPEGELFGEDEICQYLENWRLDDTDSLLRGLRYALKSWTQSHELSDDLSLLAIEYGSAQD